MPQIQMLILSWTGYAALLLLLPITYPGRDTNLASLSLVAWCAVALIAAVAASLMSANRPAGMVAVRFASTLRMVHLVACARWSLLLSLVGLACLIVDRVFIQGIDFSKGIAVARYVWGESGETRAGVSSLFSVLGYFFGFFFFVTAVLLQLHWERFTARDRKLLLAGVVCLVFANSALTGGRTILLIALAMSVAAGVLRASIGLRWFPGRSLRVLGLGLVALLMAVSYSLYVFSERASASDTPAAVYSTGFAKYLGGTPTRAYHELDELPSAVLPAAHFGVVAGMYLTHSYGTFVYMLDARERSGSILFGFVRSLLERSGLRGVAAGEWSLAGRFPSLPGGLFYDFGWAGFYAGALFLGLSLGLSPLLARLNFAGGVGLVVACLVLICALLSPLLFALDVLSVPFMIIGFLANEVALRLSGLKGSWLLVGQEVRALGRVSRDGEVAG
jgi:hypothetical protein